MTASSTPPDDSPALHAVDAASNVAAETPAGGPPAADGGYVPADPLTGHSYDGIEEYDNPMPAWWKNVFWATIIFSILYAPIVYSQLFDAGELSRYERAKVANVRLQFAELGALAADGPTVMRFVGDERWEAVGQSIYKTHCVSCHGAEGLGLVGPNLRDESYKNIRTIEDLPRVIADGAANGSMPAWRNRLSENELVMASAYVAGMRGTAGGQGKAPEGREIPPWPTAPAAIDDASEAASDPAPAE